MSDTEYYVWCKKDSLGMYVITWIRVGWGAFKEYRGGPVGEGPVHYIGVTRDPADVSHASEHVPVFVIKRVL